MSRGSYATPPVRPASTPSIHWTTARTHHMADYGRVILLSIRPEDYRTPLLAASLADKWLEIAQEVPGTASTLCSALRNFLDHIQSQLRDAGHDPAFDLAHLRLRHLDAWELDLLNAHKRNSSDTFYRYVVHVFALLRRLTADAPGSLHPEIVVRLERDTRLNHVRNPGDPDLTPDEVRRIRSNAHRLVYQALQREAAEGMPDRDTLIALHVLLSLATGEPPEVLRRLTVADIAATAAPGHDGDLARRDPADRLAWLTERDLIEQYALTFTKNRAGETYQEVYRRRDRSAHRTLTTLIRLTGPLRRESGLPRLWLHRRRDGVVDEAPWNTESWRLRRWLADHGLDVSEPHRWARLRKVTTTRESLADPVRYLRSGRRHTPKTFFDHYANSAVLRAQAGRILVESIEEKFEVAVNGPTVVTPEAEALLAQGQTAPGLDPETGRRLAAGALDGPQAACRDPKNSPYETAGTTCSRSTAGTCFGCPNALITQHHLPAALVIAELSDPTQAADPAQWLSHWKPIHEAITQIVLPAFPPEVVEAARHRMNLVPVALGTLNDMRGADAE